MSVGPTQEAVLDEPALDQWGRRLGASVEPPYLVALRGPLGAGKSVLARAIARGAGVRGAVPSPTYNLLLRYPTPRGELVHLDLYRLGDPEELWELGWQELGADDEIVLVEWPERAGPHLPEPRYEIALAPVPGRGDLRHVLVSPVGDMAPLPSFPVPAPTP